MDLPVVELGRQCRQPSKSVALARLQALRDARWAVLDFETADFQRRCVVEVGVCSSEGEVLLETYVNPPIPITSEATEIHGLSAIDVEAAPEWPDVQRWLADALDSHQIDVVVSFNAAYERLCLKYNAKAYGIPSLEPALWCAQECSVPFVGVNAPDDSWLSLKTAVERLGLLGQPDHRAINDCVATAELVRHLAAVAGQVVVPPRRSGGSNR